MLDHITSCCPDERWVTVPKTYGRYFISTCGRLIGPRKKLLKTHGKGRTIYPITVFSGVEPGARKMWTVHTLVLTVFVSERPVGDEPYEAMHLDDNRFNTHLSNLKWGTRRENQEQMMRNTRAKRLKALQSIPPLTKD